MQRTGQRRGRACHRQVRIGLRAADDPHGGRAAVLLVVGVQNEEHIERARDDRTGHIFRLGHLPQHVHEVLGIAEIVVGIHVRMPATVAIGIRRQRSHLGDQPHDLFLPVLRVMNVLGLGINRGQRRQRAHQNAHGMSVVAEAVDELLGGFMQHGVMRDLPRPVLILLRSGQLAVEQ